MERFVELTTSNCRSQPTRQRQEPEQCKHNCGGPTKHSRNRVKQAAEYSTCSNLMLSVSV